MFSEQDWLLVGEIVSPQGLKGKIRINPKSDFPERFTKPGPRWIQNKSEEPLEIQLINGNKIPGKSIYVVAFDGINNRDLAESLVGYKLLVPINNRPKLDSNEFHLLDLIGLEVKLEEKSNSLGTVKNLMRAGNDLLEIQTTEGKKVLIPFVKEIVPNVYLSKGWIQLTPPPGLLDIENVD